MSLPGPHPGPVSVISPPRSLRMHIHSFFGCHLLQEVSLRDPVPGETHPHPRAPMSAVLPGGITWFHGTSSGSSVQLPITQQTRWGSEAPIALDVSEGTREKGGGQSHLHLFGEFLGPFPGPPGGLLPSVPHPASTHPHVCQVLPATRRPALQGSGSISPDGQVCGTLGRLGPQRPCRVLPAWGWGQLGSSQGF